MMTGSFSDNADIVQKAFECVEKIPATSLTPF